MPKAKDKSVSLFMPLTRIGDSIPAGTRAEPNYEERNVPKTIEGGIMVRI